MSKDPDKADHPASGDPFLDVVEALDQGIAIFDDDAKLVHANASLRQMYPALSDILVPGLRWAIFLNEATHRGGMPRETSQALDALEARLDLNGPKVDAIHMPGAGGKVFRLVLTTTSDNGFALTQSEAVDAETADNTLREAEALLRKVLEACPASLIMSRISDGQVVYRSPAATDLLGTTKSSFGHFSRREDRADFVTALLSDAKIDNMRVTGVSATGDTFPAELSARLIDYRGEDVIVTSMEDISSELRVQAELDRQKEQLFQSEKLSALGELLAGVAHELNNPLSIIVGNADMLEEELEGSRLSTRVTKLSNAAHRCVRIVRSFLALARQEPLDLQTIDPADVIANATDAVGADMEQAGIALEVSETKQGPLIVADPIQLTQVLINLLTNAMHAISEAGIGDRIEISCTPVDEMLRVSVTDNGPGVSPDIKSRIFDPLFTTKKGGKGTGVGLAYCHRIISGHRGVIRLETNARQGATFVLEIPIDRN